MLKIDTTRRNRLACHRMTQSYEFPKSRSVCHCSNLSDTVFRKYVPPPSKSIGRRIHDLFLTRVDTMGDDWVSICISVEKAVQVKIIS